MIVENEALPSSFRDASGFVFKHESKILRQVNKIYAPEYDLLMTSGLFEALTKNGLMVNHKELSSEFAVDKSNSYRVIEPRQIPFISYPYEWSFSQFKDAALKTLEIQETALKFGMSLKDASAYNIQFLDGKPVFIDTLSFEPYQEGMPWVAYKQFCQHFLSPLALMSLVDVRLGMMTRDYIDGVPLDLCSKLLPKSTMLSPSFLAHIHFHAKAQKAHAGDGDRVQQKTRSVSKAGLAGILDSLKTTVSKLDWAGADTEWGDYYSATNYDSESFKLKGELVQNFIESVDGKIDRAIDLGANDGFFSRIAANHATECTIAADIDPVAVEKNYRAIKKAGESTLFPVLLDLTNPSPSIGWSNEERENVFARANADLVLSLAVIHHLAISNNVPLPSLASFYSKIGRNAIIEFVPKSDSQVKRLLATRKDVFPEYDERFFEAAFSKYFEIVKKESITGSERTLYLLTRKH
jgi:hypothetical protein